MTTHQPRLPASPHESPGREVTMAMDGPLGLSFTVTKAYISLLVVVLLLDTGCCVVELCLEFPDPLGLIWENVKEHS